MSVPETRTGECNNLLLSVLPAAYRETLSKSLELVYTEFKQVLYERNKRIPYVYFPCNSVESILTFMQNGTAVEAGTVGNEGFIGIILLMGDNIATDTTICQIAGDSLRMSSADFIEATTGDTQLRRAVQRYIPAYISQVSQSVACNRLHTIEERFARWLLMTQDRVMGNEFYLTQEFLADMLGVHRPSVSLVASTFQQAGIIKYHRGHMTILNRAQLEDTACECYATVRSQFKQWLDVERG